MIQRDFDPIRRRRLPWNRAFVYLGRGFLLASIFSASAVPAEAGLYAAEIETPKRWESRPAPLLIVDGDPLLEDEGLGGGIDPGLDDDEFERGFEDPAEPGLEEPLEPGLEDDPLTEPGLDEPLEDDFGGGIDPGLNDDEFTDPGFEEPLDPGLEEPLEPGLEEPGLDEPFEDDRGGIDPGLEEDEFGDPLEPGIEDPLAPGFDPGMNDDHLVEPEEEPLEPGFEDPGL